MCASLTTRVCCSFDKDQVDAKMIKQIHGYMEVRLSMINLQPLRLCL
jgi:hypothetical protein